MTYRSMDYDNKKAERLSFTPRQRERFDRFILGDDLDFYEEYVINETPEEQERFFRDNPDFMSEYPISHERIGLLGDKMYRNILRMIRKYDKEKERIKKAPT